MFAKPTNNNFAHIMESIKLCICYFYHVLAMVIDFKAINYKFTEVK